MSDQEIPKTEKIQESPMAYSEGKPAPYHLHAQYVDYFADSLTKEGEKAYGRWGLGVLQSLNDEQYVAQRQALGLKPTDAIDFYNQGCVVAGTEKYDKAAESFKKAIELNKDFAEAHYNYALALEMAGDKTAARKAWQAYLERFASEEESTEIKQRLVALAD